MIIIGSIKQKFTDFFTKGHQRSIEAKKNIAASFLIKGASIVINLALVPITINYVNPTQYGIWLTLSSIVAWFSFFDIGLGNGLRNRFAEAKAKGQTEKARIYISTTYAILALIFGTVWLLFFIANFFIRWCSVLNAPSDMAHELSILALIVFSFFCMQMVLKIMNTVLIADQKPAIASFFDMSGQLFSLLIIYILVRTTKGTLVYLGLGLGFAPVFIYLLSSFFVYSLKYKDYIPKIEFVRFSYARDIISLGSKFFLIQISAVIIFQTTNIVIAQTLNPNYVTVYNIAFKYFSVLSMAFMIIITPFWSSFTDAYVKNDIEWMRRIISKLREAYLLLIPVACIMTLLSNYFYSFWIGSKVSIPLLVSVLMAIYILLFARFNMFVYLVNGIGKIKLQLAINIFICIIYIPIAALSCKYSGLIGIIISNIIVAVIHTLVSQIQVNKIINRDAMGIWNK